MWLESGDSGSWVSLPSQGEGAWDSGLEPCLGFLGVVWGPFFVQVLVSWPMQAVLCVHPLQVLHQVLAVAGLPRVPEKHDVWSEVQTLQVRSGG